jgi:hypothetical protein
MIERRSKRRSKIALAGSASFPKDSIERPCVILNLSAIGACVAFAPNVEIPRMFELRAGPNTGLMTVRTIWKRSNTVGVAYVVQRVAPDVIQD